MHIWNKGSKLLRLHRQQNGRCGICAEGLRLSAEGQEAPTLDHIIPKSHGGTGVLHNLRAVHRRCNEARGNELETVTVVIDGQRVLRDLTTLFRLLDEARAGIAAER